MNWSWQKEYQAALLENNRLAAAQKIMIQRLQELASGDEEMPEVRALRKALDSLYGASRQTRFRPGELADEEQHYTTERKWIRIGGAVCAALTLAFATAWMLHKRTELNQLEKLKAVEAAQISSSPSRIAEPLDEPLEAASVGSNDGHPANPSGNQPGRGVPGTTAASERNTSANKSDQVPVEGRAGVILAGATAVTNPVQNPANDQPEAAEPPGTTSDGTAQAQLTTASSTELQEKIHSAPSTVVEAEERTPAVEPKTEEKPQATPAEPPPSQQASDNRQGEINRGEIRQGSVSVETGSYPSIRVPPELKKEAARSGASLQIGEPVSRVAPVYPEEAERQGIEGTVKLRAVIAKDGAVQDLEIVNGPAMLATAAVNAIRQWRYRPTLLGDQPVEVAEEISVVFRITKTAAPSN